ncbi:MAG: helix-turn-helix transcriptional regulator [Phycisphaerales bacterium]
MQTLGDLVRELRRGRDMTLLALAEAIGSTKSYLSMIENHRVANPPSDELLTLMERALGVTDGRLRRAGTGSVRRRRCVTSSSDWLVMRAGRPAFHPGRRVEAAWRRQESHGLYRSGQLRRMVDRTLGTDAVERIGKADKAPAWFRCTVPLVGGGGLSQWIHGHGLRGGRLCGVPRGWTTRTLSL